MNTNKDTFSHIYLISQNKFKFLCLPCPRCQRIYDLLRVVVAIYKKIAAYTLIVNINLCPSMWTKLWKGRVSRGRTVPAGKILQIFFLDKWSCLKLKRSLNTQNLIDGDKFVTEEKMNLSQSILLREACHSSDTTCFFYKIIFDHYH